MLLWVVVGCTADTPVATTARRSAPVAPVSVAQATTRRIIDYREFTGRTTAVDSVEIRARVSGYLRQSPRSKQEAASDAGSGASDELVGSKKSGEQLQAPQSVQVDEGEMVAAGELLFVIDPRPYELALEQSQGSLASAEARLTQAKQNFQRSDELLQKSAISRSEYDSAVAAVAELQGTIDNLKATVERNQLDLEFTHVTSPIDGLLGRTLLTQGNLVTADMTILSTVVAMDPIYVDFDVDEQSLLDYRGRMIEGQVKSAREARIPVVLGLANEQGYPHAGTIDFVNNVTDPDTGNTRVRATFPNPSRILSPGLFARVRVPFTAEYAAILIPTPAIGMDQQGRHVMVVGDNNRVARRAVELGDVVDEQTVVRSGLEVGETVVESGLQKIRAGSEVRVKAEGAE